jgi:hypothetical protein
MSTATTSADVEMAISEFNVSKQKNWANVHNDLQQQYIKSQECNGQQIINNQWTCNNQQNGYDPRNDWPDDL